VLFGGERATASATGVPSTSVNSYAMTFGGGADIQVDSARFVPGDSSFEYLYTHFSGVKQNNLRIQSGLVYHFGKVSCSASWHRPRRKAGLLLMGRLLGGSPGLLVRGSGAFRAANKPPI